MTEECSNFFFKLGFDKPAMEGSLAQKYFLANKCIFGEVSSNYFTDCLNNKIYFCNEDHSKSKWDRASSTYKKQFFEKLASGIESNSQLLAEIDYFVRGIAIADTKFHLYKLAKLCTVIAEALPLMKVGCGRDIFDVICNNGIQHHIYHFKYRSSVLLLFDVIYSLAASASVEISATGNSGVFIHCFANIVESCDNERFLPKIGPSSLSKNYQKLYEKGSAMIVCKGADIDSAVETVVRGAWGNRGYLPYSLKRLLVQENIWEEFLKKLKHKVKEFKWDIPDTYKPDSSDFQIKIANKVLKYAVNNGQEILDINKWFDGADNKGLEKPIVLIDERPYFWDDLDNGIDQPTTLVTLQGFRTCKEALLLLDKVPIDYLSVWCNNISICNEISTRANVSTVWINTFGYYDPEVGSIQNIYKKAVLKATPETKVPPNASYPKLKSSLMAKELAVKRVSEVHKQWLTWSREKRLSTLLEVVQYFEIHKAKFLSVINESGLFGGAAEDVFNTSVQQFKQLLSTSFPSNDVFNKDNHMCIQIKRPLGIIYIVNNNKFDGNFTAIIGATICGNAVLFDTTNEFLYQICEVFLLFNIPVIPVDPREMKEFDSNRTFCSSQEFYDFQYSFNVFTKPKYIWQAYGESFYDAKMLNVTS